MTTSFRGKFPAAAIKNLRVFGQEAISPAEWAKRELTGLKVGDLITCFNPFNITDGARAELEASALVLVFNTDQAPLGILLTDEFYVIGSVEAIFRERALAAAARGTNFSFVNLPYVGAMSDEARTFMTGMQRWGNGGTRANPMHNLPDPLVAFFSCIGIALPAAPPIPSATMASALLRGTEVPGIPKLNNKYRTVIQVAPESPSIESVTMIETAPVPKDPPPSFGTTRANTERQNQTPDKPASLEQKPQASSSTPATFGLPAEPQKPEPEQPPAASAPPESASPAAGPAAAESGFLSIRKRLEARLSGRLSKPSPGAPSVDSIQVRGDSVTSPVLKLVSNIRQQMSIASDNLEYRVSTLKSKMLDRLVSCKHNLSEKEQMSLKALEDLRSRMQNKLENTAAIAREDLSKVASRGTAQVRAFQSRASGQLADLLAEQELLISEKTENAKRQVSESLNATKEELDKTVTRAQHTLRGMVTTTEVGLNQVFNQCAESMEERIDGFRVQTQILAEGIGLSVESLGEAAKLQAQQSEEEVIKRLEALNEESLKSLREQSVKAEMECSKLIDKLSRDKLVPALQEKRKIVVELSAFFHDEFSGVMTEMLENRLAEFEPIVRTSADATAASLQDFKSRWTTNLEQHQKDLDEIEIKLKEKVEEHLQSSKARIESMQDITKVTDNVLSSPELIRTRDETCLKFDIIAREHVSRAYALTGDKVQSHKQQSLDDLIALREGCETQLRDRGEQSRTRIRAAIKTALQRIQDLQSKYTS